ncbi:hypothetical protein F5B21DRAFT_318350 [Xylaria acuta]|nr:hypothetical protein F5B21DRAFT_318350 [Xylaria acuta]
MSNISLDRSPTKSNTTIEQNSDLLHLLSVEKEKNLRLTQTNNSLRNALIKPRHHILDDDVVKQFLGLRNSIQGFVKSTFENELERSTEALRSHNKKFFLPFKNKERDMKCLTNRVRGEIFAIIWRCIFLRPWYTSSYGQELEDLEISFWKHLPKANLKDFVDWRSASIKCSQALMKESDVRLNDNMSHDGPPATQLLSKPVDCIQDLLLPLKRKKGTSEKKQLEKMHNLCLQAYNLAELMRNARDVFQVQFGPIYDTGAVFDLVEVENTETTTSRKENGKIAFWTFGALTKRTEENPETDTVITKGSVFVYKLV